MIRLLIVDDSAFMRKALSQMVSEDEAIEVIGTARDGVEALEMIPELRPDLVTMDIEMPRMDGLTALRQIMATCPLPVLMVSSLTREGAEATIEALQAGAVDFIPKDASYFSLEIGKIKDELIHKIKSIDRARRLHPQARRPYRPHLPRPTGPTAPHDRHRPRSSARPIPRPAPTRPTQSTTPPPAVSARPAVHARRALAGFTPRLIAIGVSTGGPFALQEVITRLPAGFGVPICIVQHMPPHFTRSLADRLNMQSALRVVEAEAGMAVEAGTVYIAAGGKHLTFRLNRHGILLATPDTPQHTPHRPSADVLFESSATAYGGDVLGVVMTGMGHDGLAGAQHIKRAGGRILAQDEASCVVYGMPRAVVEAGLADGVAPLDGLPDLLTRIAGTPSPVG